MAEDQRYLAGDRLTEADIAMFTTLVRFDEVYHTHFMYCNHQFVREYDNLWPYLRDLYQTQGVADTVDMDHIKEHYYTTHPDVSPKCIVAMGPDPEFTAPHDRNELPGGPPEDPAAAGLIARRSRSRIDSRSAFMHRRDKDCAIRWCEDAFVGKTGESARSSVSYCSSR